MNTKGKIKILHAEGIIEMNKIFAKMIENPLSDEYALLQQIRKDYDGYQTRIRQIKKNTKKETWAGLTYNFMREYITTHAPEKTREQEVSEFDELVLISKCQTKAKRYPVIKQWFLAKYPAIAKFGMPAEAKTKSETKVAENAETEAHENQVVPFNAETHLAELEPTG